MTQEEVLIKLGVNGSELARGLRSAREQVEHWGHEIRAEILGTVGGLFAVEAIGETIHKTIEYGSHMADLSKRIGVGTDALQVWDYAMKQNGGTIDSAISFFEKLSIARDKALKGEVDVTASFKAFGVTIDDLKSKRIEDIAEHISEVFKAGDPQQLISSLRDIGGKGAGEMIATFAEGIKESREEAEKLGIILSTDVIQSLKRVDDEFVRFKSQQTGWIAPMLAKDLEGINFLWTSLKAYMHPEKAQALWDEMIEADRAMKRKENAVNAGAGLGESETESHRATARGIRQQARQIEAEADRKKLSTEDQIRALYQDRSRLMDELCEKEKGEVERAKTIKELAENRKTIAEKELELSEKLKEIDKDRTKIAFDTKRRTESAREPFMPTMDELAASGTWSRRGGNNWKFNQGPFARDAQQIKWLQADAHDAIMFGNQGRADKDISRINFLKEGLRAAGVLGPDTHLESMDESLKTQKAHLKDLLDKASGKGGGVVVTATEGP